MVIYLILLIPLATVVYLWVAYKKQMAWFEYLVFIIPMLLIVTAKGCTELAQVSDTEYWGGWVTKAVYYEAWDERVSCRHPIPCSHFDEEGNPEHSNDGYEHLYDVDEHPPYWMIHDSNDASWRISKSEYQRFVKQFGPPKFVELHRDYHSYDGDAYETHWPNTDESLEPTTTLHRYENRVQASHSVFKFPKVDPKTPGLYQYPKIAGQYKSTCVLAPPGVDTKEAEKRLMGYNAKLGALKKVRLMILVFKDEPLQKAFDQEALWQGGNKNEFIVMVGINADQKVQWAYVASWTELEQLKVEAREFAQNQDQLDLVGLSEWLGHRVAQEVVIRRDFRQFSYLTVDPPPWAVVTILLVTIALCGFLAYSVVTNPITEETSIYEISGP